MHGIAELLRGRRLGLVGTEVRVIGLVAVGAPVAFQLPGVGVDDRDALVQVAVGEIRLVGCRVDEDLRDAAECHLVVAAADDTSAVPSRCSVPCARPTCRPAGGTCRLSVNLRTCESSGPLPPIQTLPLWSIGDAVVRRRPLVAFTRPTPVAHEIAFRIELEHRRRAGTAFAGRRLQLEPLLVVAERRGSAMDDPDVIALVDRHTDRRSEDPMIGQRLGPERIHLEVRSLTAVAVLTRQLPRHQHPSRGEHDQDENKPAVRQHLAHGSLLERGDYTGLRAWSHKLWAVGLRALALAFGLWSLDFGVRVGPGTVHLTLGYVTPASRHRAHGLRPQSSEPRCVGHWNAGVDIRTGSCPGPQFAKIRSRDISRPGSSVVVSVLACVAPQLDRLVERVQRCCDTHGPRPCPGPRSNTR